MTKYSTCVHSLPLLPAFGADVHRRVSWVCRGREMPFFDFIWLDAVLDKLAEREISADEIEAIISHPEFEDLSRSSGLPVAFGHLMDGRLVIVVYRWVDQVTVQPITASEVPE